MRYQWKLLILLLAISLTPILAMRPAGRWMVGHFGRQLTDLARQNHLADVQDRLSLISGWLVDHLGCERRIVEQSLQAQGLIVRSAARRDIRPAPGRGAPAEQTATRPPYAGEREIGRAHV